MPDVGTGSNPTPTVLYDEAGNRVTLVGGTGANGQFPVKFHSTTASPSSVNATSSTSAVLAANSNRRGFTIWNEGSQLVAVTLGSTATLTNYTVAIVSGGYYEAPFGYTGAVACITQSGSTTLRVTEFT